MNNAEKSVTLSNGGRVMLSAVLDLFALTPSEREFLFGLADEFDRRVSIHLKVEQLQAAAQQYAPAALNGQVGKAFEGAIGGLVGHPRENSDDEKQSTFEPILPLEYTDGLLGKEPDPPETETIFNPKFNETSTPAELDSAFGLNEHPHPTSAGIQTQKAAKAPKPKLVKKPKPEPKPTVSAGAQFAERERIRSAASERIPLPVRKTELPSPLDSIVKPKMTVSDAIRQLLSNKPATLLETMEGVKKLTGQLTDSKTVNTLLGQMRHRGEVVKRDVDNRWMIPPDPNAQPAIRVLPDPHVVF
jgi:hypothetical protein